MKEVKIFSFSKIDQYRRCPLAYKLINIEDISKLDNPAMKKGRIAHRYMELFRNMEKEVVVEKLIEEFKDPDIVNSIVSELSSYGHNIYEHCIATEKTIDFSIGVYDLRGIIDRLDKNGETYKIVDYKYGNYEYLQNDLINSLQLKLYAYYIMEEYTQNQCEIEYHNLKQNTKFTATIKKDDIDINLIKSYIDSIKAAELMDDFPPKISGNCANCIVRLSCEPFKTWLYSISPEKINPDISIEGIIEYYYGVQEKEKIYKYQRKNLEPILSEIGKLRGIPCKIDDYVLDYNRYGNIEIRRSQS